MEHTFSNLLFTLAGISIGILLGSKKKRPDGILLSHYRQILELLFTIKQKQETMNAETQQLLNDLKAEAQEQTTVIGSVKVLFGTLTKKIDDLLKGNDDELRQGLTEVRDAFDQGNKDLAAAVAANTPAEGEDPGDNTNTGNSGSTVTE